MSPDLATLQTDIVRAFLAKDGPDISFFDADAQAAAARLAIYRNTALSGLCEALRLSYPMTEKVVGMPFFEQTALAFARRHPPTDPVLARYGANFPAFLGSLQSLRGLPYLPDLARLEWAIDQVGYGPSMQDRCITLPVGGRTATVTLMTSVRLLAASTTILPLWQALDSGNEEALAGIDWNAGPQWLAIHHGHQGAMITSLTEQAWRLAIALLAGDDLAMSATADTGAAAVELLAAPFIRVALADR